MHPGAPYHSRVSAEGSLSGYAGRCPEASATLLAAQVVTGGEVDPAPAELGHAGAGGFSNDTFMLNTARFVNVSGEAKRSSGMRAWELADGWEQQLSKRYPARVKCWMCLPPLPAEGS